MILSTSLAWRLALVLTAPWAAWAGAGEPADRSTNTDPGAEAAVAAAEFRILPDFGAAELSGMPRRTSDEWHFSRRDYPLFRATEWQVRLRAPPDRESGLFEDVDSADFVVCFPGPAEAALHWSKGSHDEASDFQPRETAVLPGRPVVLESFGGRSSDGMLPYFNLAVPGGGLVIAVGWTGDWKASFEALGSSRVRVRAGLKRAHFQLRPAEEVRVASVLVLGYRGDWLDGQNQLRRLLLQHFTPTNHPIMNLVPVAASVHGVIAFNDTSEKGMIDFATNLARVNLPIDTFWIDAGWNVGGFPRGQGNPEPDPARFPQGLAPVGAAVRQAGLRFLAWFEPERVMRGTWLDREHAAWLLYPSGTPAELRYQEKDGFRLLDLGNPNARNWAIETVSRQIDEAGLGVYRQDCNLYPAYFWQTNEETNRIGLREIRYIAGLYDYLDGLASRHPGLILDNCASGGRRLDFEMMRRCVVLWRSDSCWGTATFPRNVQAMTHGLSLWLPLHGLGAAATDRIALRSGMGSCATFAINFRDSAAVAALRKHLDRYLKVRPLFAADYYPLTPWSLDPARRVAFQFHDPAADKGIVQVFWGAGKAGAQTARDVRLKLRGVRPSVRYRVTNWDDQNSRLVTGGDLLGAGLGVTGGGDPAALVFEYAAEP